MLYEYGYCSRACLAQTGQGDKCSLSLSQVPSSQAIPYCGAPGYTQSGSAAPRLGSVEEGSDMGTPVHSDKPQFLSISLGKDYEG